MCGPYWRGVCGILIIDSVTSGRFGGCAKYAQPFSIIIIWLARNSHGAMQKPTNRPGFPPRLEDAMNIHASVDPKSSGLTRPNGERLRLNNQDFVAIDRHKDTTYEPTYRRRSTAAPTKAFMPTTKPSCSMRSRQICRSISKIPARRIFIFICRPAAFSWCWSRRACSLSITMGASTTSVPVR